MSVCPLSLGDRCFAWTVGGSGGINLTAFWSLGCCLDVLEVLCGPVGIIIKLLQDQFGWPGICYNVDNIFAEYYITKL